MAKFDVSQAVQLFTENTSTISNLWGVYVVATFAAAGFGAASEDLQVGAAIVVTVGFWAFALGHLSLLNQALNLHLRLRTDILNALREDPSEAQDAARFKSTIEYVARTANPPWISISIHLLIDFCVTVALWSSARVGAG